jgi:uncharacterized protein
MDSIILEDNPHWINSACYDHFTTREILPKALKYLATKEITAIIGARRVGKSTLVKLLMAELLKTVEAKNIFFINLEKPSFIPYKNSPDYLQKIFDSYLKLADPDMGRTIYFFIDEIQIFENWEVFVKSKYENSNIKFVITGSNSSLLTTNYATLLTGRVLKLRLYSFNFREFLGYKNIDCSTRFQIASNKISIKRAFDEYLKWGGYYGVFSKDDESLKKETLKNIAEDIILKDIAPRYKIKNSGQIRDLFYYVVSNPTTLLNYASLAGKINLDAKSVKEYINYFEDNFLVCLLPSFHTKMTEQIKSAKKIYLTDNGFLNLGFGVTEGFGKQLENLVFNALAQKDDNLSYRRDVQEVDFYSQSTLYQVSYDISDEKTKKRELAAFGHFKKQDDKCRLVTYDTDEQNGEVEVLSATKFLLE